MLFQTRPNLNYFRPMTPSGKKPTKRAHYIPQVYSANFCTDGTKPPTGYLYKKSDCSKPPVPVQPQDFGLKGYYYAIEKDDGTRDTQTLEELFSVGESDWPELLSVFERGLNPYPEHIDNLCTFAATMRVRVPNFRLQMEERRAEGVRATGMVMGKHHKGLNKDFQDQIKAVRNRGDKDAEADLLKVKHEFDNGLLEIAVDPQVSIQSVQHIGTLREELLKLNWAVLHNPFEQEFVTTDNPVVHYDLAQRGVLIPYKNGIAAKGVEIIFPMTKKLMLVGNRLFPHKFTYGSFKRVEKVTQYNQRLILAAEEYVYSGQSRFGRLVKKYSGIVPRSKITHIHRGNGITTISEPTLGPPHSLPKWKATND